MITFEMNGKKVKLKNVEWRNTRNRFNLEKAEYDKEDREYCIDVPCNICGKYNQDCCLCPLGVFIEQFGDESPCTHFLFSLFKKGKFGVTEYVVWWHKKNDKQARRQIKRVNEMMDKIEEQNRA